MLLEFWENFRHNLFKPLLMFFYLGFLIPILKVQFEFPYVIYQGVTMYLLLAIGWHGGEELATIHAASLGNIVGFIILGFVLNFLIGLLAYFLLGRMTKMRRIDKATVAGYYGSDSAGTFATCVGVLATVRMAFNGFMPVMLAVMEMPGCLVALYLAARLRQRGMDAAGNVPGEPSYHLPPTREPNYRVALSHGPGATAQPAPGQALEAECEVCRHTMVPVSSQQAKKESHTPLCRLGSPHWAGSSGKLTALKPRCALRRISAAASCGSASHGSCSGMMRSGKLPAHTS
jgi:hypothetical protein